MKLAFGVLLISLLPASFASGGEIINFDIFGPVGSYGGQSFSTNDPNNDNVAGTPANQLNFGSVEFLQSTPIDFTILIQNTGGTTEYVGNVGAAINSTPDTWSGFRLSLGLGVQQNFVPFSTFVPAMTFSDTPDWDFPNPDVSPSSPQFPIISHGQFVIEGSGGNVGPGGIATGSNLHGDVPDSLIASTYELTIRLQPIVAQSDPVPEPTSIAVWGMFIFAGAIVFRAMRKSRLSPAA